MLAWHSQKRVEFSERCFNGWPKGSVFGSFRDGAAGNLNAASQDFASQLGLLK